MVVFGGENLSIVENLRIARFVRHGQRGDCERDARAEELEPHARQPSPRHWTSRFEHKCVSPLVENQRLPTPKQETAASSVKAGTESMAVSNANKMRLENSLLLSGPMLTTTRPLLQSSTEPASAAPGAPLTAHRSPLMMRTSSVQENAPTSLECSQPRLTSKAPVRPDTDGARPERVRVYEWGSRRIHIALQSGLRVRRIVHEKLDVRGPPRHA
jgi:hypothetical protein